MRQFELYIGVNMKLKRKVEQVKVVVNQKEITQMIMNVVQKSPTPELTATIIEDYLYQLMEKDNKTVIGKKIVVDFIHNMDNVVNLDLEELQRE